MFEGFVSQVLFGYLGRYVKGIQKDQLKIGIWSEEVLLEKVELILEAFDYLQLPFALKNGQVGKLSIKIPWKKLGWEPIIVSLEDVFICACQREDNEWNSDSVRRRELAGKMAKLNAIELAKFSRRVSDNPAGQSFISYISAKILDNIQVSIRNFHVTYIDSHDDKGKFIFGLRFSSLTLMTDIRKQSSVASTVGKSRSGQVNKIVELSNVGLYCNSFEADQTSLAINESTSSHLCSGVKSDCERYDYLVNPFDVTISLLVNKPGKLESAPQYAIVAELTNLVVSLNECQLRQLLSLWDYFTICSLREKYGKYRPFQKSLSQKFDGWQRMLWRYAHESVLADVRRKLRKTSWSDLGRRISRCRQYVNLYKTKLKLLQQEQLVNKDILYELEKMDKECDIDDILNFRWIAENELQELLNSKSPTIGTNNPMHVEDKQQNSEQSSGSSRGWLNWLSLGMLGAGGTADSNSFAGVVSDEIIKDIYDATEFHPVPSFNGDPSITDKICSSTIKINICQIITVISTGRYGRKIAEAIICGISVEFVVWEDSVAIHGLVDSVKLSNPCNGRIMLMPKQAVFKESSSMHTLSFINVQVSLPRSSQTSEVLVKVVVQPFEANFKLDFWLDVLDLCEVLASFQFQHNRVLLALNGLPNFEARLQSKAEYVLHNRKKINWDFDVHNVIIKLPLDNEDMGDFFMALEMEGLSFNSRPKNESGPLMLDNNRACDYLSTTCLEDPSNDTPLDIKIKDLYDHFNIQLTGFEVYVLISNVPSTTSVIEKLNASIGFGICIFFDEPLLKSLEVCCSLPSFGMRFSPSIFYALVGACDKLLERTSEAVRVNVVHVADIGESDKLIPFPFSVSVKLDQFSFYVDLEDDAVGSFLLFTLRNIDCRCSLQEHLDFLILVKMLKIEALNLNGEAYNCTLCLSRNWSSDFSPHVHVENIGLSSPSVMCNECSAEGCLKLNYHVLRDGCIFNPECSLCLNDVDCHIYPRFFGLLHMFFERIQEYPSSTNPISRSSQLIEKGKDKKAAGAELSKFRFSNFCDTEPDVALSTPVCNFPFVTIGNSGPLRSLEGSVIYGVPELQRSHVKDRQHPGIEAFNLRKSPTLVTPASTKTGGLPKHPDGYSMLLLNVNLCGFRVYFHDASCILATITLPKSTGSLSFQGDDCFDLLVSTEGLGLSSSWTPSNIPEILWGPVSSILSPVFNVRLRKVKQERLTSLTEISFGIQHVCCILPSEFLAMVIGYFSLPDWTLSRKETGNKKCTSEGNESLSVQSMQSEFLYKMEILHSSLIFPVEGHTDFLLQLELPQIYGCFIPLSSSVGADRGIPSCCLIPPNPIVDRLHVVNIFGRSTSLSLIPCMVDANFPSKLDECSLSGTIPFIEQLDADLWIRLPCITKNSFEHALVSSLIMMRVYKCNLIAEDKYLLYGVEGIANVVDQLSLVGTESTAFTSDVLQFLQSRRTVKEADTVILDISNDTSIAIKFCVEEVSVKFSRSRVKQPHSAESIAKADFQVNFSAFFNNGIPKSFDADVTSLVVHSVQSDLLLVSFTSDSSISSHLCIKFSESDQGEMQILVALPSLDVWLHLLEWNNFIDILSSYPTQSVSTSGLSSPSLQSECNDVAEGHLHCFPNEFTNPESATLTIKSENPTISIYLPFEDKEEYPASPGIEVAEFCSYEVQYHLSTDGEPSVESKLSKCVKFTLQCKYCELAVGSSYVKLKCNMEKIKAVLALIQDRKVSFIPFIQISQVKVKTELRRRLGELVHISCEVQIEGLDVGVSYQIFKFWSCSQLKIPETTSSPIPFHCMIFAVYLRKGSVRLSDGKWRFHGPIMEILMKNVHAQFTEREATMEGSASAEILVNYNNIDKVMWEPFLEPCGFRLNLLRKYAGDVHLNTFATTDIYLESTDHLNLNITEPLIEAIFRLKQLITDALNHKEAEELEESQVLSGFQTVDNVHTRRYAPYILRNDTSLPLTFQVSRGPINADVCFNFSMEDGNIVQPGHSVPIYVEETVDEQYFQHRTVHSSERLIEKRANAVTHHMISIQLDGTTGPSKPMSMDLVGLSYFEVNFSNNKQSAMIEIDRNDDAKGFNQKAERSVSGQSNLVLPVVFEVSMQHYSKMIRLYSTVVLFNATSVPLELRFDIPFGVSPKVLDPILPGQEIPLPLHLAEAGRMRWRPLGSNYLWSEAHSLSNILSQENRLGFLRSFVCYPTYPTNDPFRCCISIQDYSLSTSGDATKFTSLDNDGMRKPAYKIIGRRSLQPVLPKGHLIHQFRLTTPLLVKNYLPMGLSLMIESGGVSHSITVSEVDTASVYLVDSTHDLGITFHMQGFRPIVAKFPRAEAFSSMAKLNGDKYYIFETLAFHSDTSHGPTYVTLEKAMDAYCGARELCLSVPFLLYNCTGLLLTIINSNNERKGSGQVIPSSYYLTGHEQLSARKQGLSQISSEFESFTGNPDVNSLFSEVHTISSRESAGMHLNRLLTRDFLFPVSYKPSYGYSSNGLCSRGASICSSINGRLAGNPLRNSGKVGNGIDHMQTESSKEVKAYMYSPLGHISSSELVVRLCASLPQSTTENTLNPAWSSPFSLVPASGSTNVVIPSPCGSGAFLISATSVPVTGDLSGRTRAITFQPRYVICNACNQDLCYKQKGTNIIYSLGVGQHSHLHWSETARELYVSIRFNEPGWQWSGCFLPDCLGDVQVKMRNFVSGASTMVRVEVQNAELAVSDENVLQKSDGNSSTQLILLSEDRTGFMPYRIDNFSLERLRVYQQRCESCETTVHAYTSSQYAWDEPCYPHRLIIEVPGERIIGSYSLDSVQESVPVYLPSTSEKPERRLYVSIHAEGATKVLTIVDSNIHIIKETKESGFLGFQEQTKAGQKQGSHTDFSEVITLHLPFIGISLINSSPQEIIFACAKETTVAVMQSSDQQKISFHILALQVDNELSDTPYPTVLCFDSEHKGKSKSFTKNKGRKLRVQSENASPSSCESTCESAFYLSAAKWRNIDSSLVSFKYIHLGLAPLCIELEEQVLLSVLDFVRTVSSRLQTRSLHKNFEIKAVDYDPGSSRQMHTNIEDHKCRQYNLLSASIATRKDTTLLPSVIPIGAPWQQIYLSAKRQKKIYVEVFELAPIKLSLSFSSTPWMTRNEVHAEVKNLSHISSTMFQRGLMALVDVEGVPVHLGELILGHLMASHESVQDIVIRHYTRQILHEIYKVFGSAGVIGNPMGFARNVGLGIKDFLSVSGKGIVQSPVELLTGVAQGSKSLFSNTIYAISSAATQFSKAAHKGIVALTFDEQAVAEMDVQPKGLKSHGKGVLNEFLEGLTGFLQSPIRGAEKHGLPGFLSGIAMGTAGLVARPMASILEATGKTAQSIRNRSSPHQSNHLRIRFPRPLARELPLLPYSWEEAIGVSMLGQANGSRLKDETFIMCKTLKQPGKFIIISERLVLTVWCPCLVGFGSPEFVGVPADPEWVIEIEMSLESIVHLDRTGVAVNIVGSSAETISRQKKGGARNNRSWSPPASAPLFYTKVELPDEEEAEDVLQVLLSTIEHGKGRWVTHVLHRSNLR